MDDIDVFLRKHPKDDGTFPPVSEATLRKYTEKVPSFLTEIWKTDGYRSFGNGFFWLVNPDDLMAEMEQAAPGFEGLLPLLRTALGSVFFEHGGTCHAFDPVYLDVTTYEGFSLADVMNYSVTADKSLNEHYHHNLYEKARARLDPVTYKECYGFVPAIALGGELDANNLQKMNLQVYLQILSQLE